MPTSSMYAFITSLLLGLCCCNSLAAQGNQDSVLKKAVELKVNDSLPRQFRMSLDLRWPLQNLFVNSFYNYEVAADYTLKSDLYIVAEGGFGGSDYSYPDLSYKSSNSFLRIGVEKSLLKRIANTDWDIAFAGVRYGIGFINRGVASYSVNDSLFGNSSGKVPAQQFVAHWGEITGGIKLELIPKVFVGWNVRGKFLLNQRAFNELSPAFIGGYGKGDKSTVFDFSFYAGYVIRWRK